MKDLLIALAGIVTGVSIPIGLGYLVLAWRRRQADRQSVGSVVSPRWLNENTYRRNGDDRQWK